MRWFECNAQLAKNGNFRHILPEGSPTNLHATSPTSSSASSSLHATSPTSTTLVFLGTGAACGVPTYYCNCKACQEAKKNPRARRTCSSIALVSDEVTLIDTAPEVHQQLDREQISDVDRVLFTHEHFDHTGGIPQLEYYVKLRRRRPLDFYCNAQTAQHIASHFDLMSEVYNIKQIEAQARLEFDGISYTAIEAAHCPGAFGYLIDVPAAKTLRQKDVRIAYLPDTSRPSDPTLQQIYRSDILIIDSTFNGGNWMPTQHLEIDEAIQLAAELEVGEAFLTHLSMQFDEPITLVELEAKLSGSNVHAAVDGLRINL